MKTLLTTLFACLAGAILSCTASAETLKVATSTYPGWMDNWVMEMPSAGKGSPSLLDIRAKEYNTKVEIQKFTNYIPSVEALVSGEVDAATMAITEAITIVADKGIDAVILFPHDYSNGNDQIQIPKSWKAEDIAGKTFLLEEFSVSHYLLYRYLQENGKPLKDFVKIANTPGDAVAPAYIAALENNPVGGVTWNPGCQRMIDTGKSQVLFTSKDIPGEITDVLVIRKDRIKGREDAIKAYVAAHFDVMDRLTNPETRQATINAMAFSAGFKPEEFGTYAKMLDATRFYTNRTEAAEALENPKLVETMAKIKEFYATYGEPNPDAPALTVDTSFLK